MTKQFEKKLQFFKDYVKNKYNKDVIESESGNYYAYLDYNTVEKRTYNSYNVTKATVSRIGTEFEYPNSSRLILMLSKNSRFKKFNGRLWKAVSRLDHEELYFYNKKCSWLMSEPIFNSYKICRQFKSLSEFKEYCGYKFIDDNLFREKFSRFSSKILLNKDKTLMERIKLMFITEYMSKETGYDLNF